MPYDQVSGSYQYDPNATGAPPQSNLSGLNTLFGQTPQNQLPSYLQQQNNPSLAGGINNMVRALQAGWLQKAAKEQAQPQPQSDLNVPALMSPAPAVPMGAFGFAAGPH